jgi:UDPglucose 6-dehydrogenase
VKIAVVGMGHVGLIQAVAMAAVGHDVIGIDTDETRIHGLNAGGTPFHEPGLQEEMRRQIDSGRLRFTISPVTAYTAAGVIFLCVGTPPRADGGANLIAVENAAKVIRRYADPGSVVVEKSTVPPGTHQQLIKALDRDDLHVASNPEFLREGTALKDTLSPTRIVVGTDDGIAAYAMRSVYQPLTDSGTPYVSTDIATAELSKHASNSMLSLKISFINAIAQLCDQTGADVSEVARIMGLDPRIGPSFLDAGIGFGGFCFPKDVAALSHTFKLNGVETTLLDEVLVINEMAVYSAYSKIEDALWHLEGKRVCLLGAAFKPDTDDTRFSPAVKLAVKLVEAGATVTVWDPQVKWVDELHDANARRAYTTGSSLVPAAVITDSVYEAADAADVIVIATDWDQISDIDWSQMRLEAPNARVVVDGRNYLGRDAIRDAESNGFAVVGMGR